MGKYPVLLVGPRMIALYAHTVLDCYATTDYTNYRDFSFAVSRYILFRLDEKSDRIQITEEGDTTKIEAGVSVPELETLDVLFKEIMRLKDGLGGDENCLFTGSI